MEATVKFETRPCGEGFEVVFTTPDLQTSVFGPYSTEQEADAAIEKGIAVLGSMKGVKLLEVTKQTPNIGRA